MTKKKLKREIYDLKKKLKTQILISERYESLEQLNKKQYLEENALRTKQYEELVLLAAKADMQKQNLLKVSSDFGDVFHDVTSKMEVLLEVQTVCIKSVAEEVDTSNRAEHFAWFFSYIQNLLKRESNKEFDKISEEYRV